MKLIALKIVFIWTFFYGVYQNKQFNKYKTLKLKMIKLLVNILFFLLDKSTSCFLPVAKLLVCEIIKDSVAIFVGQNEVTLSQWKSKKLWNQIEGVRLRCEVTVNMHEVWGHYLWSYIVF